MANVIRQPCDEGVIRSKEVRSACSPNTAPWVLAATILGSSMAFIDETALPVALPAIQDGLGATAVDAQWVVASSTLFLAALVLGGVVFGLLESTRSGLGDARVIGALIVGVVALGAFLIVEGVAANR
jgi:hypothetical protein